MFVNLVAPINPLGYGVVGFNVLKHLVGEGHQISLFPIGGQATWESDQKAVDLIQKAVNNSQFFDPSAPSLRVWHQHDLAMFPGGGERIGWPIFELDTFSDKEEHHMRSVDRLFVCSQWAKDVCIARGIDVSNIDVVPLGVDSTVFYPDEQAQKSRPYWNRESTVFINVGKLEVRKGHNELLEAFCKAFSPEDNVELWMLNHNPFIGLQNENWKVKYITSPMGGKIKILPRVDSQTQLRQLFNQVDFGVFPSHAEGWNLEPLELMACGVPSIMTNYSGHTEYVNKGNSLLVEPNGMEKAHDAVGGKWFNGQGDWCTFEIDELVSQLREAHKMKQENAHKIMHENCLKTAEEFSWNNSVKKILRVL